MAQGDAGKTQQSEHKTESSTIISIGELMQMEQHRIDEEKRRRERQRLEHEAALRTARAKREQEIEQQRHAQDEARRVKQQQEAREAAELVGRMLGFISRAKVQGEHEAAMRGREQEHRLALELEQAKVDSRVGLLRSALLAVCLAAVLALGGLAGAYAGIAAPAHQRQVASLQSQLDDAQRQVRVTERELEAQRDKVQSEQEKRIALERSLTSASRRIEALEQQLTVQPGNRPGPSHPPATNPPLPPSDPCPIGDPMCGLERR